METKTQHGYLILADISGYTSFLASTELEHAHEILTELLELIVDRFKRLLIISKLEGDAVFAYVPETAIGRGETLVELIESTYVAFQDRIKDMARSTTCNCNACRAIPTLDLKFMTHHGDYIVQDVAGIRELVGSDVNLVHRLMKNHVADETGWKGYSLFTEKSLDHIGVRPEPMHKLIETYDHLGDIETHSVDMHARYKQITDQRSVVLTPEEADVVATFDFSAPPAVVWDWVTDPKKRTQLAMGAATWSNLARPGGRTAIGAQNHCAHGKEVIIETILDWKPFDYYTSSYDDASMSMMSTWKLTPTEKGTCLQFAIALKFKPMWMRVVMSPMKKRLLGKDVLPTFRATWESMEKLFTGQATLEQLAAQAPAKH